MLGSAYFPNIEYRYVVPLIAPRVRKSHARNSTQDVDHLLAIRPIPAPNAVACRLRFVVPTQGNLAWCRSGEL